MEPYIGEIKMFAGNYAPQNWATCDGQLMSISQNSALFSLLGTTYGGDGMNTFALPDLRSRAPIHAGQGRGLTYYTQGQTGGNESVTLTQQQMPAHSHALNAYSAGANQILPTNYYLSDQVDPLTGQGTQTYSDQTPDVVLNPGTIGISGGNQPVATISPVLAVTFIIALNGVWPSRP